MGPTRRHRGTLGRRSADRRRDLVHLMIEGNEIEWDGASPLGPARGRCLACGRQLLDGRRRSCPDHR